MVEVAVIGAGAAGLVTARNLLRCGLRACVFESRMFNGGAWSAAANAASHSSSSRRPEPPQMWDNLTPNLSKYTCAFSDHPWPAHTPTFPTLANMNEYLNEYANEFVVNDENCVMHHGCTVTNVEQDNSNDQQYIVEWVEETSGAASSQSKTFDGVVVASGFFSTPIWPSEPFQQQAASQSLSSSPTPSKLIHSSQYRSPEVFANQTVAVIGGGFSACEIASDVRRHAKRVVNVLGNTVPYVLPRYISKSEKDGFLPIDYVLYQRGEKEEAPKVETVSLDPKECRSRHEFLRGLVGPRKRAQARIQGFDLPDSLTFDAPPVLSISDDYLDLVIDGKIEVAKGRMKKADTKLGSLEITLDDGTVLPGIDSIIACTGYRSNLDFLSPGIRETLQYDASDSFAPMTLCYDTFHPKLPGLGFVGMYRGTYFGVMELQAKLYSGLLSKHVDPLSDVDLAQAMGTSAIIRQHLPRAQFPHFDYIGYMDTLAKPLKLVPDIATHGAKGRMVAPAFYQPSKEIADANWPSEEIADETQAMLEQEVKQESDNIPRAALSALVGRWNFEREIHDHLTCATQRVHGQVAYSILEPKLDSLRYREDGFLDLENGNTLEVFREYDYICAGNTLELYFVENGERTYLFLSLKFEKHESGYWLATSDHLCIKDLYKGTFQIAFDGLGASEVIMTYRVKGPAKDYESTTRLSPIL